MLIWTEHKYSNFKIYFLKANKIYLWDNSVLVSCNELLDCIISKHCFCVPHLYLLTENRDCILKQFKKYISENVGKRLVICRLKHLWLDWALKTHSTFNICGRTRLHCFGSLLHIFFSKKKITFSKKGNYHKHWLFITLWYLFSLWHLHHFLSKEWQALQEVQWNKHKHLV